MAGQSVAVARAADIKPGDVVAFDVGTTRVAIANVDGRLYAFSDICTHEECNLADGGILTGMTIECPCHGAQFDVATGKVMAPPAPAPIATYPVHVRDGQVIVEV